MTGRPRKHPWRTLLRLARLWIAPADRSAELVEQSYGRIGLGYDEAWTHHMRDLTEALLEQVDPRPGERALDLACGTGFATRALAARTGAETAGVDRCEGMLGVAREHGVPLCRYIRADILAYLEALPARSLDVVTCCWGLGYSRPARVLGQVRRVLRPGGRVGVIDNSLFSLAEVLYCSLLAFMETPERLRHLMRFRFLPSRRVLGWHFLRNGLSTEHLWSGHRTYQVASGREAIGRLRRTGAAAGFEYAAGDADDPVVFDRFAQIIEEKYQRDGAIPITHRYLAGVARR